MFIIPCVFKKQLAGVQCTDGQVYGFKFDLDWLTPDACQRYIYDHLLYAAVLQLKREFQGLEDVRFEPEVLKFRSPTPLL